MTGRTYRWLGLTLVTVAAAAILGLTSMMRPAFAFGADIALIMGGTGPPPPFSYVIDVNQVYITPGYTPEFLYTPEQFAPFTGIISEPLSTSVAEGATDLNGAINAQLGQGNDVVAFGYSQSAAVASLEEQQLAAPPATEQPSPDHLSFVLIGNPDNPDGGLFERLAGLVVPALGVTTPLGPTPDDVYPTTVYTAEYDGFADFPQYPTNILADLNALLGVLYAHTVYPFLTAAQVGQGVLEPVSSPDSTYILIPSETLPLLVPLRGVVPAPLLDLIEPDLKVLIDLGYDRTAPQDVLTPAELFPTTFNPITVLIELIQGTVQGIDNALADEGLAPLPNLPVLSDLLDLLNSLSATTAFTLPDVTFAVPAQISDLIDGPLNGLDALLNTAINDELDPAIQSTISAIGDALTTAATSLGAPALLTNAIQIGEELAPLDVEGPGVLVTTDAQGLIDAVQDLAAGNLSGFAQELGSIGAQDIILAEFFGVFNALTLVDILTGMQPEEGLPGL